MLESSFHGRIAALATLRATLRKHPVVQIVGPPGVGKTRLAAVAMAQSSARWIWIDLARATRAEQVRTELRFHGLWVNLPPNTGVVLDAVDGAAADMSKVLRDRPDGTRVILTARHAIDIPGAVRLALDPLTADAADAMLVEACALAELDPISESDRQALLACLDRLPGAIAIASRWLAVEAPVDVIGRVTRIGIDDPARARPLSGAWSRLGADAQMVFMAAASISNARMETLEIAVGRPGVDVALRGLMHAGMLQRVDDDDAYFAPYATTRAVALRHATADLRAGFTARLSAEIATRWPQAARTLAGLHTMASHGDSAMARHVWQHAGPSRARVIAGLTYTASLIRRGLAARCRPASRRTLRAAEVLGDLDLIAWSHFAQACTEAIWCCAAVAAFAKAARIAGQVGDARLKRAATRWAAQSGCADAAARVAKHAADDALEQAEDALTLGRLASSIDARLAYCQRAMMLGQGHPGPLFGYVQLAIGEGYSRHGDATSALTAYSAASTSARELGEHRTIVLSGLGIANAQLALAHLDEARAIAGATVARCTQTGDARHAIRAELALAIAWPPSSSRRRRRRTLRPVAGRRRSRLSRRTSIHALRSILATRWPPRWTP